MNDDRKHKNDAEKSKYRRDKIKDATPASLSKDDRALMAKMYLVARQMSQSTGIKYQVDHIIPLAVGGLHVPENLQIITEEQNKKRGSAARLPEEGAILSNHVKEEMIRDKGKFVKGISGNPKGRPKKEVVDQGVNKDDRLLLELFGQAEGDVTKFRQLALQNISKLTLGLDEYTKALKRVEDIGLAQQKVDKNATEKVHTVKILLTTNEDYDRIKQAIENGEEYE